MYIRLFVILIIFFTIHLFLYFSVTRFFAVTNPLIKNILFIIASFLSISFMVSAILLRVHANPFTKGFYAFSAFWSGLAIYMVAAALACYLIAIAAWIFGKAMPMRLISSALFSATFLFSVYGVWNAFHPKITSIGVEIPGLPEKWAHKTIVQISDVHLGAIYTPQYLSKNAETINSLHPDLIFITGDLFDSISAADINSFAEPLNKLQAKDGIFYVNGNHENYIGAESVMSALAKTKIKALRDEVAQIDGVQIIGVDYPEFGAQKDVEKIILSGKNYRKGLPSILLYHTPTNIEQKSRTVEEYQTKTYWRPDLDFTAAKKLGVNLQLSGHTHKGQMIPFVQLAAYLYNGYAYGLHRQGDFSIYITSGLGTVGPPIRIGSAGEIVVIRLKPASK